MNGGTYEGVEGVEGVEEGMVDGGDRSENVLNNNDDVKVLNIV
jgi:hypothetical protein